MSQDSNSLGTRTGPTDYKSTIDRFLESRNDLADKIAYIVKESTGVVPRSLVSQLEQLRGCPRTEELFSSGSTAVLLPLVIHHGSGNPHRFARSVQCFVDILKLERRPLSFWKSYSAVVIGLTVFGFVLQAYIASPVFEEMFREFGLRLPALTRWQFSINRFIREQSLLAATVFVLMLSLYLTKDWWMRRMVEQFQHWWTVSQLMSGSRSNLIAMSRFSGTLAELVALNAPIHDAVQISGVASQHRFFCNNASLLLERSHLPQHSRFPELISYALERYSRGESCDELLREAQFVYGDRALYRESRSFSAVQPVLVVVLGAIVGLCIIAYLMPLIGLVTALS